MMTAEAKVGVIVVSAILLVVCIAMFLGGLRLAHEGYEVHVLYNQVLGIGTGAPVRLAGVKIGEVKKVELAGDKRALVTLKIKEGVSLETNALFTIKTGLLVGESYVEVQPTDKPGSPLQPGQTLVGIDPVQITDIVPDFKKLMAQLGKLSESANLVMSDRQSIQSVQTALRDLSRITGQAYTVVTSALDLVKSGQRTLDNFGDIAVENKDNLKQITGSFGKAASNIEVATETIKWLMNEGHVKENLRDTVEYVKKSGKNVESAMKNLDNATKNVEKVTEKVRTMVEDPEVQTNVKESLLGTKKVIAKTELALDQARKLLETGDAAIKKVSDRIDSVGRVNLKAEPEYGFYSSQSQGRYWADLNLKLYSGEKDKRYYLLGVHDLGDSNKLNLQIGSVLNPRTEVRYGIYRSKLGAGVDYRPAKNTRVLIDAYDPNKFKVNLWTEYTIKERWQLLLGIEDMKYGGIGIRYQK